MKMFKTLKQLLCAGLVGLLMSGAAQAGDQGSPQEAEAMVKKGVAYIKANGPEKAYEEFTNGASFKERDLYLFVYDMTGKNLAHGANPKLVGKDLIGLKDPNGKLIIVMLTELAKTKGKGWSDEYMFRNPVSQKLEPKIAYLERVGDIFVGAGVYKN
jgi:cytochrome c